MLIDFGHFALVLALVISVILIVVPSIGLYQNKTSLSQLAKPLVWAQGFWIAVAFFVLMSAFLTNDFSVKYVAENSNTQLPVLYKAQQCGDPMKDLYFCGCSFCLYGQLQSLYSLKESPQI